jgi:hypothetical protein
VQWFDHLTILVINIVRINCVFVQHILRKDSKADVQRILGDFLDGSVDLSFLALGLQRIDGVNIFLADVCAQIVEVTNLLVGDDGK